MARERETPEFASMVRRQVRALGRRVADGDPVDLGEFRALQSEVDDALRTAVRGLRDRHSWAQIAEGLGTTRQSAHERFSGGVGGAEYIRPDEGAAS